MAFSTEGAISGGMAGFQAGGPIGGLIGAGIGGLIGGRQSSSEKKARRQKRAYMAQAIEAITRQNEISASQWKFYQENVQPMEEQIGADLAAGRVGGAPEAMQETYRSKAGADVMQSFARQREITKRSQAQYGIDPTSGAAMAQEQKQATAAGLGEAGAMTRAGERAGEDYRGERDRFINRWSGAPEKASQGAGEAGGGFASAADYQGGLIDQSRARTAGQVDAFMPLAKMGSDAYANRGGGAEANPTYNNPSFAEGGPAVGEAIAGGYDMASAEGGAINGPGGPVDDQVPAKLPKGSYVIPADVVSALGVEFFDKIETQYAAQDDNSEGGGFQAGMQQRVNAMTSDGEYVISAAVVKRKGKKFFDDLLEKYHKPAVDQSKQYQKKTAAADATNGSKHQFITAANGYRGGLNQTAPAGPNSRHYSHGGQVPIPAGVGANSMGGGGTMAYHDGGDSEDQIGRRGGKSLKDGGVSNTGSKDGELIKPDKMARRGRLRHGRRADGGHTGGKDLYQGTYKEGGYTAGRTSVSENSKPLGMHGKDGGPAKKKTRRGGKKHKTKYQDGGMKTAVKPYADGGPTKAKAKKMLKDDQAQGKPLTDAQKGLFGLIAGGKRPSKLADGGKPKSDWQLFMGNKPRPPGKNIRGDYTGTGVKKPKTGPVKRRVYASEPGAKKYGEE